MAGFNDAQKREIAEIVAQAIRQTGGFSGTRSGSGGGGGNNGGGGGNEGSDDRREREIAYQEKLNDLEEKRVKYIRDYEQRIDNVRRIQKDIKVNSENYSYYVEKLKEDVKQLKKSKQELLVAEKNLEALIQKYNNSTGQQREQLEEILKLEIARVAVLKDEVHKLEESNREIAEALKNSNALKGIWKSMGKDIEKVKEYFGKINKFIGASKLVDWEKSFRATELSMGLSEQNSDAMLKNMTNAAMETTGFGYTIKELAELQGQFSDEIGRGTLLSESTMKHMSAVAKASGLGAEGAAKFAGDMDKVGFGAGRTAKFIDQAMMDATSMGLNSTKVIKNLSSNLKLLNRYNFKGGSKGLKQMAENATKMGVEMDMVAGMADKLFDIEGAVEMSAQLQVLGGEWSKLADPFKLMYMARNDMKGLQETMINATIASADFNAETKEYEIQALELHKLKKVAEATGVDFDQLATAAKKAAQFAGIRKQIRYNFDEDTKKFIENQAYFNEKGEAEILINGDPKLVSQLTDSEKKFFNDEIQFRKDALERAKKARALDEKYEDIKNTFATLFFPIIKKLSDGAVTIVEGIREFLNNEMVKKGIWEAAKMIGNAAMAIGKFISQFPAASAGILVGLAGMWAAIKWIMVGKLMRTGFMMGGPIPTTGGIGGKSQFSGGSFSAGKKALRMRRNMRIGAGSGLLAGGFDSIDAFSEGRAGEGIGNIAGGVLGGVLGSFLGPLGGMLGGMAGSWVGGKIGGLFDKNDQPAQSVNVMNDGIVFNPRDKFMKVNDATMIAGTKVNGNTQLAKELMRMNTGQISGTRPGTMNVSHSDINTKVGGEIRLVLDGASSTIDAAKIFGNPEFEKRLIQTVNRGVAGATMGNNKTKGNV